MNWRCIFLAVFAFSLFFANESLAQRDRGDSDRGRRGRGGGDRGGNRSDRGGGRDRGSNTTAMLQNLDRNGNGQLDPDEMQGNAGRFIEPLLRNTGINTGRPVSLNELQRMVNGDGNRDSDSRDDNNDDDQLAVKPFGNDYEESIVPGFGPMDASIEVALYAEHDERTIRSVNNLMDRADTNHNGTLDRNEWAVLDGRYDTDKADKNHDGRISRTELADQIAKNDRSRDRGRGDKREERGREERGREERGREERGGFNMRGGGSEAWRERGGGGGRGGRGGGGGRGRGRGGNGDDSDEGGRDRGERNDDDEYDFRSGDHDSRSDYSLSDAEEARGIPSEFARLDSNGDGQVSMSEFLASSQSMNAAATEFDSIDLNGDGILAASEIFTATDRQSGGSRRSFGTSRGDADNRGGESRDNRGAANSSTANSRPSDSSDKFTNYAASTVSKNDKNNNNMLDQGEWPNTKMVDLKAADTNKDGKLTVEEITAQLRRGAEEK